MPRKKNLDDLMGPPKPIPSKKVSKPRNSERLGSIAEEEEEKKEEEENIENTSESEVQREDRVSPKRGRENNAGGKGES
jgi:hypothetical protein